MKSIKEKAEELYPTKKESAISDLANEKFVEGANYVLNEIGMLLEAANKYEPYSIPTWRLRNIIEQLKK